MAKAIQVFDAATVGDQLLDEVSKPLKGSDIMTTLREISNLGATNHLLPFNLYLRQFAQAGIECMDDIRHLRLLSNADPGRMPAAYVSARLAWCAIANCTRRRPRFLLG